MNGNINRYMKYSVYLVKKDDTLAEIARRENSTVSAIKKLNSVVLFEGERLIIPKNRGKIHIVKPFESLESIAALYNTDSQTIASYNGINAVFLGQTVYIPQDKEV